MAKHLTTIIVTAMLCMLALACSTDAAPGDCIDAADDAGVPEAVVDWMKQPSDELGSIERIAIREALEKFGLGVVCSEVADGLGLDIGQMTDTGISTVTKAIQTEEPTSTPVPPTQTPASPGTPATPLPPDTPTPNDTPTPVPSIATDSRVDRQPDGYVIEERYDDYPEIIGIDHRGTPGNSSSRFVILLDELVHVKEKESVYLRVQGPDGDEQRLELRTWTSNSTPVRALEFGPVEEPLSRLYSLEGASYIVDGDEDSLQFDSDEIRRHPNTLFVGPGYNPDLEARGLGRCAAVMEFNGVSPILVKSLRTVDVPDLSDTERFDWYSTLIDELGSTSFSSDRVDLDFDHGIFMPAMRHPCAILWSEEVTAENADKRNSRGDCRPEDPDVKALLEAPYLGLSATDRLVLKRELGGWNNEDCVLYYPQLYSGLWVPLPIEN